MYRNYIMIAWRNITNNKVYATINIFGLAIGLAVCMMIMLYVGHEYSYDKFHKNADRIFWIQGKLKMGGDSIFMPMMSYATGQEVKRNGAFVESFVRFRQPFKAPVVENRNATGQKFQEGGFFFADSNYFSFFNFPLIRGNASGVLTLPNSLVISEKAAEKYFGNQDPIGKQLRYNNELDFTITGVAKNTPSNSSLNFDFIASLDGMKNAPDSKRLFESQEVQLGAFSTYFLLKNKMDGAKLEMLIAQLNKKNVPEADIRERYIATPIVSTHLKANYADGSNTKYIRIFPFVAALVLLLALINYVSLATARSAVRAKEIGVRKVLGASRFKIASQFFVESALYTIIAFVIGYLICFSFQPAFFDFLQIKLDHSFLNSVQVLLTFAALFIITVILSATYPSLLLSAYKPVMVLYGKFSGKGSKMSIRRYFTIFQFTITVLLIICGIVIDRQLYFFRHKETGVNRENVLMIPFRPTIGQHFGPFKRDVMALPSIEKVATAHYAMYKGYDIFFTKAKDGKTDIPLPIFSVDENFIPLLGLQWKDKPADELFYLTKGAVVLNETAVEKMGFDKPLNEKFDMGEDKAVVMGVLKDFNYASLQNKVGALCMFVSKDKDSSAWGSAGGCLFAKIKASSNLPTLLDQLKTIYNGYDQTSPFEYSFMDDAFDGMYKAEDKLAKLFSLFTAFTIIIACLGLFSLSTFMAIQRTKEIGVRKVLGASVAQIAALLSKDFIKLVCIAIIVASPIAWWAMNNWLEGFAYRVHVSWWMIAIAGLLAIVIALVTVSFQSVKAALGNPVKSLRTE
jgi:putative ABC transport system permease protein